MRDGEDSGHDMIRLLIAEDEPLVREGLATKIPWQEHGVEMVGAVEDGDCALRAVDELRPDVILADIRMPGIDGLELARRVKDKYADTFVILLTGYGELEYAQAAVEIGASSFLLKPIEEDELFRGLDRIRREIARRGERDETYRQAREILEQSRPVLREHFLLSALKGSMTAHEMLGKARFHDLDFRGEACVVGLAEMGCGGVTDEVEDAEVAKILLQETIRNTFGAAGPVHFFAHAATCLGWILIVKRVGGTEEDLHSELLAMCETARERAESTTGLVTVALSALHGEIEVIPLCYAEAAEALAAKTYMGRGVVIGYAGLRRPEKQSIYRIDERELRRIISEGDERETDAWLDEYFRFYRENSGIMVKNLHLIVFELINQMVRIVDLEGYADKFDIDEKIFDELLRLETLDEARLGMGRFFRECRSHLSSFREDRSSRVVSQVKGMIDQGYMRNLGLKDLASSVYLCPAYLSRLFSAQTGLSFTEYLLQTRVRKAKELLRNTDLPVYQVSAEVGYENEKYFHRLFKKREGMSPGEYRRRLLRSGR